MTDLMHAGLAVADRLVQEAVQGFHRGAEPPGVHHLLPIAAEVPHSGHPSSLADEQRDLQVEG